MLVDRIWCNHVDPEPEPAGSLWRTPRANVVRYPVTRRIAARCSCSARRASISSRVGGAGRGSGAPFGAGGGDSESVICDSGSTGAPLGTGFRSRWTVPTPTPSAAPISRCDRPSSASSRAAYPARQPRPAARRAASSGRGSTGLPRRDNGSMDGPRCPACGTALSVCPVCGTVIAASPGRGRPRRYCSDRCRWKAGHQRARARAAEPGAWSDAELGAFMASLDPLAG